MNDYQRTEFIKQNEVSPPAWAINSKKTWVPPISTYQLASGTIRADTLRTETSQPTRERAPEAMVEAVEVAAMNEAFYMIPGCTEELFNKRLGWVYDIAGPSISNVQFSHAFSDSHGLQMYSALVRFSNDY